MSIRRLKVNMPDGASYEVRIGKGTLKRFGECLREINDSKRCLLLSDNTVGNLYGKRVRKNLEAAGYEVCDLCMPDGEESKSLEVAGELWNAMAEMGFQRDDLVVALGGGVVSDMCGFVSSTFMRGIPFVMVPTTLLAMVDACVGGKNGINLTGGKNLVGTFYQPLYVLIDLSFLATLPEKQWLSGYGEIAKSAIMGDNAFFNWFVDNRDGLMQVNEDTIQNAVVRCIEYKAGIVAKDEKEKDGRREVLNYGHTLAHAIESATGYDGSITHGVAVAEGMRFAARLGAELLGTDIQFVQDQDELLDSIGLPPLAWNYDPDELYEKMATDKKGRRGSVRMVLPKYRGTYETVAVPRKTLMNHLYAWSEYKAILVEQAEEEARLAAEAEAAAAEQAKLDAADAVVGLVEAGMDKIDPKHAAEQEAPEAEAAAEAEAPAESEAPAEAEAPAEE